MDSIEPKVTEENLDPGDWNEVRQLGHRMIDEMMTHLETVRERPIWQPIPDEVRQQFKQPLPIEPTSANSIYEEFLEFIPPYNMGAIHPRFWGWVIGNGTTIGVLADFLAATLNPNLGGGDHSANLVEAQVLDWFKEIFSFPHSSSGLLVSGGSMANLVGLTVARNDKAKFDIRKEGLQNAPQKMVLYSSSETHSSNIKGVELLGLGKDALRLIPVNSDFEIDIDALEASIAADKAAGYHVFCIIGNAGTVNTAATDDLNTLADICEREDMWFHIDGAFGSFAAIAPGYESVVSGMDRADSLAFDMHKWMYIPYDVGCALVRNRDAHYDSFAYVIEYLSHQARGVGSGDLWFSDYGVQLSRGFRALKVWMSVKEHGVKKYGRMILKNIEQAQHLDKLVRERPELELMAPSPLNIVCFRYRVDGSDQQTLNKMNEEILFRLHEEGIAVPSYTTIDGNYAIRVAITNHRTQFDDLDLLVREVLRIGSSLD